MKMGPERSEGLLKRDQAVMNTGYERPLIWKDVKKGSERPGK